MEDGFKKMNALWKPWEGSTQTNTLYLRAALRCSQRDIDEVSPLSLFFSHSET